jgi:hypothetical protein
VTLDEFAKSRFRTGGREFAQELGIVFHVAWVFE